jgi:hypothetical protein
LSIVGADAIRVTEISGGGACTELAAEAEIAAAAGTLVTPLNAFLSGITTTTGRRDTRKIDVIIVIKINAAPPMIPINSRLLVSSRFIVGVLDFKTGARSSWPRSSDSVVAIGTVRLVVVFSEISRLGERRERL